MLESLHCHGYNVAFFAQVKISVVLSVIYSRTINKRILEDNLKSPRVPTDFLISKTEWAELVVITEKNICLYFTSNPPAKEDDAISLN